MSIGTFGAHGLSDYLTRYDLSATLETAVRYHIYHAPALFAAGWAAGKWPGALTTTRLHDYLLQFGSEE